ncbi:MAG: glycine cleavage T C-terminal barrel domain-containing protein [Acidobacteriota bacterium]
MPGIAEEYRIAASGAAWVERAARGRIRFEGPDSASFLQALLSNDILRLTRGQGVYATYLTPLGRMIADIEVLHRGDALLGIVADGTGPALAARFDLLIFSEAVTVTDQSSVWTEIAVSGGQAADVIAAALAMDPAALSALPELSQLDAGSGFVVRGGDSPWPMFRIVVPIPDRDGTIRALESHGARAMSEGLAETLRVEAGRPQWGQDLTPETIPLEAGLLDRAISTSKGCYVGQEIIIRILHRGGGRVAKRLVKLALDPGLMTPPASGTNVLASGHAVGHITSAAFSPANSRVIALAYVHRDSAEVGTPLTIEGIDVPAAVVGVTG